MREYMIYKTTNTITGIYYIGVHSYNTIEFDGYFGSGIHLQRAIKKYGKENFTIEIIEEVQNDEEACNKEKYWINYYNSYDIGYNATLGGEGKSFLDYNKIVKDYEKFQNSREVARINNCSRYSVINILKNKGIPLCRDHRSLKIYTRKECSC